MSKNLITISAKELGGVALPDFCPRCFWVKRRCKDCLPFQIFPSIFNTIDHATKNWAHAYFDEHGKAPECLNNHWGPLVGYVDPPGYQQFSIVDKTHNICLRGTADAIFIKADGGHVIGDYKTAFPRGEDDPLFKMYETQINVYARIAPHCGIKPITDLALIYTQPMGGENAMAEEQNRRKDGFALPHKATIYDVPLRPKLLDPLLATVRKYEDMDTCPAGTEGCRNCQKLDLFLKRNGYRANYTGATATDKFVRVAKYTAIGCA